MKNKTILVTGGAGFIGSAIAKRLLDEGNTVVIADNLSTGKQSNIPEGCEFIRISLENTEEYNKFENYAFDVVCHLAGQSSGEASFGDPEYDFNSHVKTTFNLLTMCRDKGIKRFLYSSSMASYGDNQYLPIDEKHPQNPKTYYAAGKMAAEAYIKFFNTIGINTTTFRFFSVYGPNQDLDNKMQGMVSIFLSFILNDEPVLVKGSKDRFRDFIFIEDLVDAWIKAIDEPATFGNIYNLASGKKTTVEELVNTEIEVCGKSDYQVDYKGTTPGDQFGAYGDIAKLKKDLKWEPKHTLKDGLTKMVAFYNKEKSE